jgi:hypothetical protein
MTVFTRVFASQGQPSQVGGQLAQVKSTRVAKLVNASHLGNSDSGVLSGGQYCPENYYEKLLWEITMDNCGADLEEIAESTDNGRTNQSHWA